MRPLIALDAAILAGNYSAWCAYAGVPVRAVIKCNGYNWGYESLVRALDPICETYCVADIEELLAVRALTDRAIVVLGAIASERLAEALDAHASVTIETREGLAAVVAWSQRTGKDPGVVRVGVLPALGFAGIGLAQIEILAPEIASTGFPIEVWTHITDPRAADRLRNNITQAVHTLRSHGVRVVATEIASTYPLVAGGAIGDCARIGIGLFGSTGGTRIRGVRCALQLVAPVVARTRASAGTKVGYGERKMGQDGMVLTLRCGYGDGLPKSLGSASDILSVGMQYTTMRPPYEPFADTTVALLGEDSDLDAFAAGAGVSPHELVTALGNASTASNVSP